MKNYQKPQAIITTVFSSEQMANSGGLTDWLENPAGLDSTANITTYVMNS